MLAEFTKAGIDLYTVAEKLQHEAAKSFFESWNELMAVIEFKAAVLTDGLHGRVAS